MLQYTATAHHTRDTSGGLRLHLVCTLGGLPVLFALTGAKADERETLRDMLDTAPDVLAVHPGQTIIGDKNYFGREFEHGLAERHLKLLRPARKGEAEPAGSHLFKPLRQVIESINQTFKGQLNLERHGGKSPAGVSARVLCRILALTAAIWHNDQTGQPIRRSLTAYDHSPQRHPLDSFISTARPFDSVRAVLRPTFRRQFRSAGVSGTVHQRPLPGEAVRHAATQGDVRPFPGPGPRP